MALDLVREPWEFDVLLMENMFGDIRSDLGAGLVGGMGMAPCAEIGGRHGLFQPPTARPPTSRAAIYGCPVNHSLTLGLYGVPARRSMRSWESVRLRADQGQGFPRSHGPAEKSVDHKRVKLGLTSRRSGLPPDIAAGPASGPLMAKLNRTVLAGHPTAMLLSAALILDRLGERHGVSACNTAAEALRQANRARLP